MRWLKVLILLACLSGTTGHAQFVGTLENDLPALEQQLASTLAASSTGDQAAATVSMEELFRLWRTFRRMNLDAHADDPDFERDMARIEQSLWEASQRVDVGALSDARAALVAAGDELANLRERYGIAAP